jgi:hypothetical protein
MTRGTITNKQTGLEISGEQNQPDDVRMEFIIDGTTLTLEFLVSEWDFTPEPEPIKPGVYIYAELPPERAIIRKYYSGEWRDADGYTLISQDVNVSELVRLVPEEGDEC